MKQPVYITCIPCCACDGKGYHLYPDRFWLSNSDWEPKAISANTKLMCWTCRGTGQLYQEHAEREVLACEVVDRPGRHGYSIPDDLHTKAKEVLK